MPELIFPFFVTFLIFFLFCHYDDIILCIDTKHDHETPPNKKVIN